MCVCVGKLSMKKFPKKNSVLSSILKLYVTPVSVCMCIGEVSMKKLPIKECVPSSILKFYLTPASMSLSLNLDISSSHSFS